MKNGFFLFFLSLFFPFMVMAEGPRPYTVFLPTGTVLTKISDKSEVTLSKGIYANVLEVNPKRRDLFNIYNKNGMIQYQTTSAGIVEIAEDFRLLPNVDAERVYPPKNVFNAFNKTIQFNSQLNIHYETLQVSDLNSVYNDQISTVQATRYEVRTLYVPDIPIEFGLNLNYQSAYWKNSIEEIKLSILSFGPQFKYKLYGDESFNAHALLGTEIAPLYRGISSSYTDQYSAVIFDLGIESEWHTSLGLLSLGGHYRHHDIALTESDRPQLEMVPKEFSLNSLGLMIGYKIEWNL